MLMVTDALKVATQKVTLSIINIFIFRYIYSTTKIWLSGFYAFFLTIFIANKVRNVGSEWFKKIKFALFPQWQKYEIKFDKTKIESINLINNEHDKELIDKFINTNKETFQNDLFSYIFGSSSQSAILTLVTIIAIEYINNNYFENIVLSILTCVGIAFFVCFGASFKYSSILSEEWSALLNKIKSDEVQKASEKSKKILYVYNREIDGKVVQENLCLWWCQYDQHTKTVKSELKFLSASYADFLGDIINHFVTIHVNGLGNQFNENNDSTLLANKLLNALITNLKNERHDFLVPDYYDQSFAFSNAVKKLGYKKQESWKEFKLFPSVDFKITLYTNANINKLKTN